MAYKCFVQQQQKTKADEMLQRIIAFNPKTENTVSNFYPSNTLVTAWAYEKTGALDKAILFLNEQEKSNPKYKSIAWSKAIFEGKEPASLLTTDKEVNLLIIEALLKKGL